MPGTKNLKPVTTRSKEEAREISAKGGRASGAARRKNATFKAALSGLLQNKIDLSDNEKKLYKRYNIPLDADNTVLERMITVMVANALKGDQNALEYALKIMGEDPVLALKKKELEIREREQKAADLSRAAAPPKLFEVIDGLAAAGPETGGVPPGGGQEAELPDGERPVG